jgi:hypothetical protein
MIVPILASFLLQDLCYSSKKIHASSWWQACLQAWEFWLKALRQPQLSCWEVKLDLSLSSTTPLAIFDFALESEVETFVFDSLIWWSNQRSVSLFAHKAQVCLMLLRSQCKWYNPPDLWSQCKWYNPPDWFWFTEVESEQWQNSQVDSKSRSNKLMHFTIVQILVELVIATSR